MSHEGGSSPLGAAGGVRGAARSSAEQARLFRRREEKYEVGPATAVFLREEISRELPLFQFEAGEPETFITTLYFDTRERELFHRAEASYEDNLKVRVKEYYYRCEPAGRAAVAPGGGPSPGSNGKGPGFRTSPYCYVELKQTVHGVVVKKRFPLRKGDLRQILDGRDLWSRVVDLVPPGEVEALREIYVEFLRCMRDYSLELTSVVTYRRVVYQEKEEDLRITFDDNLMVYAPPSSLYDGVEAFTPETLGGPLRRSERVILEIKCAGEYPPWLRKTLAHHAARRLSKFTSSVRILLRDVCGKPPEPPAPADPPAGTDTQQMAGFFT